MPLRAPAFAAPSHPAGLDVPARLRILVDGYGLPPRRRAELPAVVEQATEVCRAFVARRVADGAPGFLKSLAEQGGWERWDRTQAWLAAHRETFTAALLA